MTVLFCLGLLIGGVGVVIRDWRVTFVLTKSDQCLADLALIAECWAARLALATALELGLRCVVLEGDSLKVISLLSYQNGACPWSINWLIHDYFYFISLLSSFCFSHIKRCANTVAVRMAKHGSASTPTLEVWPFSPLSWIGDELNFDVTTPVQPLSL